MIVSLVAFFNSWNLLISFLCHLIIFVSLLYTAIHNRELTEWVITPIWYLGLTSGFVWITVLVQWAIGPEHPMSYWTLGQLGEISSHIILAAICATLFFKTIKSDIENRKSHRK